MCTCALKRFARKNWQLACSLFTFLLVVITIQTELSLCLHCPGLTKVDVGIVIDVVIYIVAHSFRNVSITVAISPATDSNDSKLFLSKRKTNYIILCVANEAAGQAVCIADACSV